MRREKITPIPACTRQKAGQFTNLWRSIQNNLFHFLYLDDSEEEGERGGVERGVGVLQWASRGIRATVKQLEGSVERMCPSEASEMCLFSLHGWQTQAEVPAPPCLTASEIPELRLKIVNAGKKRGKMCIRKTPSFSRKIIGNCVQKQKERRLVPVLSSGALVFGQIVD